MKEEEEDHTWRRVCAHVTLTLNDGDVRLTSTDCGAISVATENASVTYETWTSQCIV